MGMESTCVVEKGDERYPAMLLDLSAPKVCSPDGKCK